MVRLWRFAISSTNHYLCKMIRHCKSILLFLTLALMLSGCRLFKPCDCPSFSHQPTDDTEFRSLNTFSSGQYIAAASAFDEQVSAVD